VVSLCGAVALRMLGVAISLRSGMVLTVARSA
jgi:hypothetical protein